MTTANGGSRHHDRSVEHQDRLEAGRFDPSVGLVQLAGEGARLSSEAPTTNSAALEDKHTWRPAGLRSA
jgi:hypothetical protein